MKRLDLASPAAVFLAAASVLAPPAAVPASASSPAVRTLALVDGTSITTRDLDALLAAQGRPEGAAAPSLTPDGVLKRLIQNRLLEEEGYRIGADEEPEVRDQVWDFKRHRAMMALLDSVSADVQPPDLAELDAFLGQSSTMWRVSHIQLDTEARARALLDSVAAGVPFEELARRHSTDSTTAVLGGDLGWAREDRYVDELHAALSGVPKGAVAGPLETGGAWQLLMLADTRTETIGQSEAMRQQLRDKAMSDQVMAKVRAFVADLRGKYGVAVDDSLRTSLDYGSPDAAVQDGLRQSEAVLVRLPWRDIRVRDLTRQIRFQYFHGVQGKEDAAEIRDKVLDEWVTELVLRHEASERGFDRRPEIAAGAEEVERQLLRERVGGMILAAPFDPQPAEIERYWREHPEEFTPPARVQADGVLLADEAAARRFRAQVDAGAKLRWLAERTPEVQDRKPALFADWVQPSVLGLAAGEAAPGKVVGPFEAEGAWAVAAVARVEPVGPVPLEQCRDRVLAAMKGRRSHDAISAAMTRLESAARIEIADGAREAIATRLDEWLGGTGDAGTSP